MKQGDGINMKAVNLWTRYNEKNIKFHQDLERKEKKREAYKEAHRLFTLSRIKVGGLCMEHGALLDKNDECPICKRQHKGVWS